MTTQIKIWWDSISLMVRIVFVTCVTLYLIGVFTDFPPTTFVCFSSLFFFQNPIRNFYTLFTHAFFHLSFLHILFNMMAELSIGVALEHQLGTIQVGLCTILFCIISVIFQLVIGAVVVFVPPLYAFIIQQTFGNYILGQLLSCGVGFSGILFGYMVTNGMIFEVAGASVFGLFQFPAKIYPWILLVITQILIPNASIMGHLGGMLGGYFFYFLVYRRSYWKAILQKVDLLIPAMVRQIPSFITSPELLLPLESVGSSSSTDGTGSTNARSIREAVSAWLTSISSRQSNNQGRDTREVVADSDPTTADSQIVDDSQQDDDPSSVTDDREPLIPHSQNDSFNKMTNNGEVPKSSAYNEQSSTSTSANSTSASSSHHNNPLSLDNSISPPTPLMEDEKEKVFPIGGRKLGRK